MYGDLIAAGGRLLGGFMESKDAEKDRQFKAEQAAQDRKLQMDFAQQGIRWKVADAAAAGIHPLYALGAQSVSYSPVSVGSTTSPDWSGIMGGAGQDIGRAINATRTSKERDDAFTSTLSALGLEKAKLENEVLRTEVASRVQRLKQSANPPMPGLVPESTKYEDRPKLALGGRKIATDPDTTNMEDFEKRYGDDGPISWLAPLAIAWQDYKANSGRASELNKLENYLLHVDPRLKRVIRWLSGK